MLCVELLEDGLVLFREDGLEERVDNVIIEAQPVPIAVYRVLDGVLETLAGAAPET